MVVAQARLDRSGGRLDHDTLQAAPHPGDRGRTRASFGNDLLGHVEDGPHPHSAAAWMTWPRSSQFDLVGCAPGPGFHVGTGLVAGVHSEDEVARKGGTWPKA